MSDSLTAGVVAGSGRVSAGGVAKVAGDDSPANAEVGEVDVRPIAGRVEQVTPLPARCRALA